MGAVTGEHTEVSVAKLPNQPDADRRTAGADGPDDEADVATADADATADPDDAALTADRSLWQDVRIDPVEIALPAGVGYTLRAYRSSAALTPTDISERDEDDLFAARQRAVAEEDEDDESVVILDEEFAAALAEEENEQQDGSTSKAGKGDKAGKGGAAGGSDDADADADVDDTESADSGEEVPIFLSHRGKLLLFRDPEALVSFVRSGASHDLAQLDSWPDLVDRLQPADVAALPEDTYELDLVVENLRGGHDAWDAALLIQSGEVARDLAYALRMPSVLDMLSTGSRLDDLDEALRSTVDGGIGGFMARRKLKKIGAQTASLGWRTIIGKISAAADWRD
ncbi:DNA primase [Solwaraspora sp. WMMD937]|uniref:DNA primase n=1 Tax=Solwaraspora sp. WMMD937 TaxID=3016090 RepID=UPI00249AB126|nr:DNA primase [Solwaraspora sp. WMMD937]WFE24748.1 DNA primase [Solwaraspora sp. WMMD937]